MQVPKCRPNSRISGDKTTKSLVVEEEEEEDAVCEKAAAKFEGSFVELEASLLSGQNVVATIGGHRVSSI